MQNKKCHNSKKNSYTDAQKAESAIIDLLSLTRFYANLEYLQSKSKIHLYSKMFLILLLFV